MTTRPRISGFTIVRNAIALDYPFRESLLSLVPLCDEVIIACGESDDGTEKICRELAEAHPSIRVISTKWSLTGQRSGNQLRHQTDVALAECKGDWCFYLQADEVLHELDYDRIRNAIREADTRPDLDGVVFDYLHFYASYEYEIRGREWYRREVRVFKNGRNIRAFRDAQGFRCGEKRLRGLISGARVFHYGYVRSSESLRLKSAEMSRLWGETPAEDPRFFSFVRHVGLRKFEKTHPNVMRERIARSPVKFNPSLYPRRWSKREVKNALTLFWESLIPVRLGEFRNYDPA